MQAQSGTNPFWRGQKKVDFGIAGGRANIIVWNGEQDSPIFNQSFGLGATANTPAYLEFARIDRQLALYSGRRELGRIIDLGVFSTGELCFGLGLVTAAGNEISLLALAAAKEYVLGAAVGTEVFAREGFYIALARDFTLLVPGKEWKWMSPNLRRIASRFARRIVAYAEGQGQKIRGHVLVWHEQLPAYIAAVTWTGDTLLAADAQLHSGGYRPIQRPRCTLGCCK